MIKQYVQGVLCAVAIIHLYLYSPSRLDGNLPVSDGINVIYYMACEVKHLLQIPLSYGFLILGLQFLWPSARERSASKMSAKHQTGEQSLPADAEDGAAEG